jgi:hypothetical protein
MKVHRLRYHLAEGTFIKYYFRPLNMMFYYMSEMVDIKGFTQVALGIALMIYASSRLGLAWTPRADFPEARAGTAADLLLAAGGHRLFWPGLLGVEQGRQYIFGDRIIETNLKRET